MPIKVDFISRFCFVLHMYLQIGCGLIFSWLLERSQPLGKTCLLFGGKQVDFSYVVRIYLQHIVNCFHAYCDGRLFYACLQKHIKLLRICL